MTELVIDCVHKKEESFLFQYVSAVIHFFNSILWHDTDTFVDDDQTNSCPLFNFYHASACRARYCYTICVRLLSIRLWNIGIVSKRINVSLNFIYLLIGASF